jgi:hypothetical protein
MTVQSNNNIPVITGRAPAGFHHTVSLFPGPCFRRTIIAIVLCILLLVPLISATGYVLTTGSVDLFRNGIHYTGKDNLTLEIGENVTIAGPTGIGIDSIAPVIIRSSAGKTLTILVRNDTGMLYGINTPSVTIEGGNLEIFVNGTFGGGKGLACGIYASSGNVTIYGGSVFTNLDTNGHKNKGIYAARYIVISGGRVSADQHGGANTFGLDGGNADITTPDSGVMISGGYIQVNSTGPRERNVGIDSKAGTVDISGNTALVIRIDGNGSLQNYAYNSTITTIHWGGW